MDRRAFIGTLAGGLLAAPLAAEAQQAGTVPRIGVLTSNPMTEELQESFRQGLRDHGYIEGKNTSVEWRAAGGRSDLAKALAVELVRSKVDVIVAIFTPAVQAAKDATSTIPIVMAPSGPTPQRISGAYAKTAVATPMAKQKQRAETSKRPMTFMAISLGASQGVSGRCSMATDVPAYRPHRSSRDYRGARPSDRRKRGVKGRNVRVFLSWSYLT